MDELKLRYFHSVAQHRSFTQAAREFHVVPATVSRQISLLEEDLGAPLFYRDTHSVELTPAGKRLYDNVSMYRLQLQTIRDNARNLMLQESTPLSITCGPLEFPLVHRLTQLYRTLLPDADLHLVKEQYNRMNNHIRAGTMHLALTIRPCARDLPDCETVSLGTHQWKAVTRRDSEFWTLPPEDRAVLRDQKLVRCSSRHFDPVYGWVTAHPMAHRGISLASAYAMICVQASLGAVAILPEYLEPWLPAALRMEQVFPDPPVEESVLILNRARAFPQERQFFDYIRDHFQP